MKNSTDLDINLLGRLVVTGDHKCFLSIYIEPGGLSFQGRTVDASQDFAIRVDSRRKLRERGNAKRRTAFLELLSHGGKKDPPFVRVRSQPLLVRRSNDLIRGTLRPDEVSIN